MEDCIYNNLRIFAIVEKAKEMKNKETRQRLVSLFLAAVCPIVANAQESEGLYFTLQEKFIEGNAAFMSLVALALIVGLTFCIERLIYLTLSEINYHRLLSKIESHLNAGNLDGAMDLCRNTRGPVSAICYQALLRYKEPAGAIERSIENYGNLQVADLEKGCSWITLCIAIAPSLGFLGTVIGMVMAFDQIGIAGDISPTIVADGLKVALITTIFGIIAALILQLFYNVVLSRIDRLTVQMEDAAISIIDLIEEQKKGGNQ